MAKISKKNKQGSREKIQHVRRTDIDAAKSALTSANSRIAEISNWLNESEMSFKAALAENKKMRVYFDAAKKIFGSACMAAGEPQVMQSEYDRIFCLVWNDEGISCERAIMRIVDAFPVVREILQNSIHYRVTMALDGQRFSYAWNVDRRIIAEYSEKEVARMVSAHLEEAHQKLGFHTIKSEGNK